ncbi:MAG: GntR family transcriptional regulator [Clostridiales bacterium]|nr:GntR family transcriptional regulator [Clostridiales bacterium]
MTAKYRVLADKLKEQIDSGTRGRLPTERELCQIHGVSRQTVRQALALLQKENYIEKRQGSGNYILGAPREEPRKVALITTGLAENLPSREILDFQSFFPREAAAFRCFLPETGSAGKGRSC